MNKKHSVSSLIAMLYFLYVMFFMKTISIARTIGILSNENKIRIVNKKLLKYNECIYLLWKIFIF
ncbi:MAG: hypothetical protein RSD36_08890 [Terrisporobacter sp.]